MANGLDKLARKGSEQAELDPVRQGSVGKGKRAEHGADVIEFQDALKSYDYDLAFQLARGAGANVGAFLAVVDLFVVKPSMRLELRLTVLLGGRDRWPLFVKNYLDGVASGQFRLSFPLPGAEYYGKPEELIVWAKTEAELAARESRADPMEVYSARFAALFGTSRFAEHSIQVDPALDSTGPRSPRARAIFEELRSEPKIDKAYEEDARFRVFANQHHLPEGVNPTASAAVDRAWELLSPKSKMRLPELSSELAKVELSEGERETIESSTRWSWRLRSVGLRLGPDASFVLSEALGVERPDYGASLLDYGRTETPRETGPVSDEDHEKLSWIADNASLELVPWVGRIDEYENGQLEVAAVVLTLPEPAPTAFGFFVDLESTSAELGTSWASSEVFEEGSREARLLPRGMRVEASEAEFDELEYYFGIEPPPGTGRFRHTSETKTIKIRRKPGHRSLSDVDGPQRALVQQRMLETSLGPGGVMRTYLETRGELGVNLLSALDNGLLLPIVLVPDLPEDEQGDTIVMHAGDGTSHYDNAGIKGFHIHEEHDKIYLRLEGSLQTVAETLLHEGIHALDHGDVPSEAEFEITQAQKEDEAAEHFRGQNAQKYWAFADLAASRQAYATEFRAYWVMGSGEEYSSEFEPNMDGRGPKSPRARHIFEQIINNYELQAKFYLHNEEYRQYVDNMLIPEGENLVASPLLHTLWDAVETLATQSRLIEKGVRKGLVVDEVVAHLNAYFSEVEAAEEAQARRAIRTNTSWDLHLAQIELRDSAGGMRTSAELSAALKLYLSGQ